MKVNTFLMTSFLKAKLVDEENAKKAYEAAEKNEHSFFAELIDMKLVKAADVYAHLSKLFGIEFTEVNINQIQDAIVNKVDNTFLMEIRAVPLRLDANKLIVLIDTPFNISNCNLVRYYLDYNIEPKLVTKENLDTILNAIQNKDRRIRAIEELQISENKVIKKTGEELYLSFLL